MFTKYARAEINAASIRISDALPIGRLWYTKPDDAIEYAKFRSRSHHAVIRVYDAAGNPIGRFSKLRALSRCSGRKR
jgi:hypothetical protein